jgi:hypothetical protein
MLPYKKGVHNMKQPILRQHVVSTLVENRAGTLSRVSGLFARRGYNIDSLTVGETEDPAISRMTIAVTGSFTITAEEGRFMAIILLGTEEGVGSRE